MAKTATKPARSRKKAATTSAEQQKANGIPLDERLLRRVAIENVYPEVDGGRFPIKRTPGETVIVNADIIADGHDLLSAVLLHRRKLLTCARYTSRVRGLRPRATSS